jgi:beta-lactam-binding protein with PASTA domain
MIIRLGHLLRKTWVQTILVIFGAGVVFVLFLNYVAMPLYVNHGGTLTVPNVTGLPLADAKSALQSVGLEPVEAETRPDPDQPVGTVMYQNPPAMAIVKHGRRIYLTVSGGDILIAVPQLRGKSLREAKFALERYGLKLGSVTFAPSDQFPENTIASQTIAPDARIPRGSRVGIIVSSGNATGGVTIPNVVGKTLAEAERIFQLAGLDIGNVTYQMSYELIPNTVVEQFPRAGEIVPSGKKVDLFVVKAGKPTEEIQSPNRQREGR